VDCHPLVPYLPDLLPDFIAVYSVLGITEYLSSAFFPVSPWAVLDVFDMRQCLADCLCPAATSTPSDVAMPDYDLR